MTYRVKSLNRDNGHQLVDDIKMNPMVHVLSYFVEQGVNIFKQLGGNGFGVKCLVTEMSKGRNIN